MGGNTPLILKTLYSVMIELADAALATAQTLEIFVNGTSLGSMLPADGKRKEFVLTTEITSQAFRVEAKLTNLDAVWNGYIKRVTLRYVPTQFKKLTWGFAVRLERNQKLLDGSPEPTKPLTKLTDLETAWKSNLPITFTDLTGTSYTVLVTDFRNQRQVIAKDKNELETIALLELLEV